MSAQIITIRGDVVYQPTAREREPQPPCELPTLVEGDISDAALIKAERQVAAAIDWINANPLDDDEMDRCVDQASVLEDFIAEVPAFTPAGIAAKVRRLQHYEIGSIWNSGLLETTLAALARLGAK